MLASLSSKAIMAKAKAMYGKRLTKEQYKEMMYKKTVAEVADYLRSETAYADDLSTIVPSTIHRGQLENMLQKVYFDHYNRLINFTPLEDSGYYSYLIRQVEINQIMKMIRLLNSNRAEDYITQYPEFMDRYASFNLMHLAKVRSFDDLLAVLKSSHYEALLMKFRPVGDAPIDYTACEMSLMGNYYLTVELAIDKSFTGKTKKDLHEIFDTIIELKNITSIYRLKKYFPNASYEYIKSHLLPRWNRLPQRTLDELIRTKDSAEFIKKLTASPYARFLGAKDYVFIEYSASCIRYNMCKRYLRFSTEAAVAFTAYMVLSEMEFANIACIIEGIRYQISPTEIEKLLVY